MPLTDTECRKAKAGEKDRKLADSGGLYLFVTKSGAKSWRLKYRFGPRADGAPGQAEKRITFGLYPEVTLAEAREKRDAARKLLRANIDPAIEIVKLKLAAHVASGQTFEPFARNWLAEQSGRWSPVHVRKSLAAFERDIFPALGSLPLRDIDGRSILASLRNVERRGAIDTAKRIRQHVSAIFAAAVAENLVPSDPAASLGKALKPLPPKKKQPGYTALPKARQLLADVEGPLSPAGPLVKLASRLLSLTGSRPGNIRQAMWPEFENIDWEAPDKEAPDALWRISAERMKLSLEEKEEEAFEHVVPLTHQAVEVLHAVRRLTGRIEYLFPNARSNGRPMTDNALSTAYRRLGHSGRHVPHGWRATFSTIMNEWAAEHGGHEDRAIIDLMIAHKASGVTAAEMAYNRARHMKRRRQLAAVWADMLTDGLLPPQALLQPRGRPGAALPDGPE